MDSLETTLNVASLLTGALTAVLLIIAASSRPHIDPIYQMLELSNRADDGAQAANTETLVLRSGGELEAMKRHSARMAPLNRSAAWLAILTVLLSAAALLAGTL